VTNAIWERELKFFNINTECFSIENLRAMLMNFSGKQNISQNDYLSPYQGAKEMFSYFGGP